MTWRRIAICAVLLGAWLSGPRLIAAQSGLDPGNRIRILPRDGPQRVARFIGLAGDSVRFMPEGEHQSQMLSLALVRRIDVSRGRTGAGIKGMMVGGLAGVALAGVMVLSNSSGTGDLTQGQTFLLAAGWFALLGSGAGVLVGSFVTVEDWRRVHLDAPAAARAGLGVRIAF